MAPGDVDDVFPVIVVGSILVVNTGRCRLLDRLDDLQPLPLSWSESVGLSSDELVLVFAG